MRNAFAIRTGHLRSAGPPLHFLRHAHVRGESSAGQSDGCWTLLICELNFARARGRHLLCADFNKLHISSIYISGTAAIGSSRVGTELLLELWVKSQAGLGVVVQWRAGQAVSMIRC